MALDNQKVKESFDAIAVPVGLSSAGLLIFYSLFNYIFFIRFRLLSITEEFTDGYIPIALSILFLFLFIRPLILRFDLSKNTKNFLTFVSLVLIAVPLVLCQHYIEITQHEIVRISAADYINPGGFNKYYEIDNFIIDKVSAEYYNVCSEEKRGYTLSTYIAVPIVSKTDNKPTNKWACYIYRSNLSSSIFEKEEAVNKEIDSIFKENRLRFIFAKDEGEIKYFSNIKRLGYSEYCLSAIGGNASADNCLLLKPEYESIEARSSELMVWVAGTFILSNLLLFLMFTFFPYDEKLKRPVKNAGSRFAAAVSKIINDAKAMLVFRNFPVTAALGGGNCLIFLIMVLCGVSWISPSPESLLAWGGNANKLTLHGEPWRLLTYMFLHSGIFHLLTNLYALLLAGIFLEMKIKRGRILLYYFAGGISAGLFSAFYHLNAVSVGASGAIMGLYGLIITLLITKTIAAKVSKNILIMFSLFVIYNLLIGISKNYDNAAHISGLLTGIAAGLLESVLYRFWDKRNL